MLKDVRNNESSCTQLNLGSSVNAAGRDFVDVTIFQSTDTFLEIASEDEIARHTQNNSRLFKRRFKVEITNPEVRAQTLEWQRQKRDTDGELRRLRSAGHLRITPTEFRLEPCRFFTMAGQVQLALVSLYCVILVLEITLGHASGERRLLGDLMVGSLWLACAYLIYHHYLEPAQVLKRICA